MRSNGDADVLSESLQETRVVTGRWPSESHCVIRPAPPIDSAERPRYALPQMVVDRPVIGVPNPVDTQYFQASPRAINFRMDAAETADKLRGARQIMADRISATHLRKPHQTVSLVGCWRRRLNPE
jgi:hypothetical protein